MPRPGSTVGADKNYDTAEFVAGCRELDCLPHVAQNDTSRCFAIDRRTTRHAGYAVSQAKRKRIEECFGWFETIGTLRKTRHRGRILVEWFFGAGCRCLQSHPHSKDFGRSGIKFVWSIENGTTAVRQSP